MSDVDRLVFKWMLANELGEDIPDDAYLSVDTVNRVITVEKFFRDADGTVCIHGGGTSGGVFTVFKKFPLLVDIDPELYTAYQQWRVNLKADRSAEASVKYRQRQEIADYLRGEGFVEAAERVLLDFPTKQKEKKEA